MKKIKETREPQGQMISMNDDGSSTTHPYGETIKTEYECPCGKGKIIAWFENLPGYRDSDAYFDCEECRKVYKVSYNWAADKEPVLKPR